MCVCVCVRQVWLWSYRGDEGTADAVRLAVVDAPRGLLYVVTLRSEVTARIETHDIARRCGCARAR